MQSTRQGRIQILTATEIDDLYRRPEFNQTEREEFFSLDTLALGHVRKMEKLESKIHFILFIGYFRSKPVIPQFHLRDVRQDVRYIGYRKYKPPFCSSSEVSYLKFPHSFTAQAPILTAGPA
ncbi:TPA: DUF4158 domain-containing protein [Klebsiella pneumoniae]|nr:DUF4158 domain-containing protein [Klebsiella pneumoniae]HBU0566346.1 DUF4158 domain-containing protein [Klebsiella pneumoniae]